MRSRLRNCILLSLLSTVAVVCVLFAQEPNGSKRNVSKDAEAKRYETVTYQAKLMKAVWGEESKVLLSGGVKFVHGDTVVVCDEVHYDQKTGVAVSSGKLQINDPQCDIAADKGWVYFKDRRGVLEGNVSMLLKPKQEEFTKSAGEEGGESIREKLTKPTTITCARLEYNYRSKVATATGGVKLQQNGRTVTAEKLVYDDKNQLVTLVGSVKGIDEEGQTFEAPEKVVISVKKGAEWMEAPNATVTFKVESGEEGNPP
ncbi:MAG: LptA/OstA family protein [Armatimonadota bacterium]